MEQRLRALKRGKFASFTHYGARFLFYVFVVCFKAYD